MVRLKADTTVNVGSGRLQPARPLRDVDACQVCGDCPIELKMSNKEVHAAGLLNRALDPATQPADIRAFLQAEIDLLDETVVEGMSVIDIGCGTGRHLAMFGDRVKLGLGIDYEGAYLTEARRRTAAARLHFVIADAARLPLR